MIFVYYLTMIPEILILVISEHGASLAPRTTLENVLQDYRQSLSLNKTERSIVNTNKFQTQYDFIIVGAGSGGSVIANRLSEIPNWSILLIEAGKEENFLTDIPLLSNSIPATDYVWKYYSARDETICKAMHQNECFLPKGKAVGGSSVVNMMMYTRGSRRDYDAWERLGNTGWSYDDVLPYFKKSEDIGIPDLENTDEHSTGGPVSIQYAPYRTPLAKTFLDAGVELGYNISDVSSNSKEGFSYVQATMRNGERCSASKAFLRTAHKRPNLHITKQATVTKLIIDPITKQAEGVEFVKSNVKFVVGVRKEVILSAGALNSPRILMLSGVGTKNHLEEIGIPVIQDLKVGHNLQDHVSLLGISFVINDTLSLSFNRLLFNPTPALDYVTKRKGPLTLPGGVEAIGMVKTKYATREEDPDIELVFSPGSLSGVSPKLLKKVINLKEDYAQKLFGNIKDEEVYSITPLLLTPKSRGYIKLRSANPFDHPLVYPNYFEDERDIRVLVEGAKLAVGLSSTLAFQRYGSRLNPTPYPGCEHHLFLSDYYWECCIRHVTGSGGHMVGTCKMGPASDSSSVVDHELRVRGIKGLRVIDASIMPVIPTAHTNAVVYMIAEKGADMIKREHERPYQV